MADARGPWNEVGGRLGALALKLKLHAQEEITEERKAEAKSAVERFGATNQGAIDGLGDAAKDPAVKEDVKAAREALSTAVTATVEEVLKAVRRPSSEGSAGAPGPASEPTESGGTASGGAADADPPAGG